MNLRRIAWCPSIGSAPVVCCFGWTGLGLAVWRFASDGLAGVPVHGIVPTIVTSTMVPVLSVLVASLILNPHILTKTGVLNRGAVLGMASLALSIVTVQSTRLRAPSADGADKSIRLLNYNVLFRGGAPDATLALIRDSGADILTLQEVTRDWQGRLQALEGYDHHAIRPHRGTHGFAILSKFPLSNVRYLNNAAGRPILQCADMTVDSKVLLVCNVHLASPASALRDVKKFRKRYDANARQRAAQWEAVVRFIDETGRRDVVIGADLNTLPNEATYQNVRERFVDVFRATRWGLGGTFPRVESIPQLLRIDYVLTRGALAPTDARVLDGGGSDHAALLAHISLSERSSELNVGS